MRGKGDNTGYQIPFNRITPAHAGKRTQAQYNKKKKKDHPRTCGEKTGIAQSVGGVKGSPPHMRGKVLAI